MMQFHATILLALATVAMATQAPPSAYGSGGRMPQHQQRPSAYGSEGPVGGEYDSMNGRPGYGSEGPSGGEYGSMNGRPGYGSEGPSGGEYDSMNGRPGYGSQRPGGQRRPGYGSEGPVRELDSMYGRPGYGSEGPAGGEYGSGRGRRRPGYGKRRGGGPRPRSSSAGRGGRSSSRPYGEKSSSRGRGGRSSSKGKYGSRSRSSSHGRRQPGGKGGYGRRGGRGGKRRNGSRSRSRSSSSGSSSSRSRSSSRDGHYAKKCQRRRRKIIGVSCDCDAPTDVSPDNNSAYPTKPPTPDTGACTKEGEMKCSGQGFLTCNHGKWVQRACAAGTFCRPFNSSILCDHAENKNAERCTQEGQHRCSAQGPGFESCANGIWVKRACGPATKCKMVGAMPQCL